MGTREQIQQPLQKLALVIGVIAGIAGLAGAWLVLPYRVSSLEARVQSIVTANSQDRELLVRIDERLTILQKTATKLEDLWERTLKESIKTSGNVKN